MEFRRPMVKAVHQPHTLPDGRIIVGLWQYGVAAEIEDDDRGSVARLLTLMDGTRDIDAICAEFGTTHPGPTPENVREVIHDLLGQGFVEDAAAPLPQGLSAEDAERYRAPRDFYAWIDSTPRTSPYTVQQRLRRARVTVLGLGGTGTAVASGLVASGVGHVHCVDFDTVEPGNLTRQLLYEEADVGRPKTEAAVRRLRGLNSRVTVTAGERRVGSASDVAELMAGCDAFVLCADKPADAIQEWTNTAALRTRTPWFLSLYAGPMIVVGSFLPYRTGCWACLRRRESERQNRAGARPLVHHSRPNAVVAAVANAGGHLCALDVVYHLAGLPRQTAGRVYHHNVARWEHHYMLEVSRDDWCRECGDRRGTPS